MLPGPANALLAEDVGAAVLPGVLAVAALPGPAALLRAGALVPVSAGSAQDSVSIGSGKAKTFSWASACYSSDTLQSV